MISVTVQKNGEHWTARYRVNGKQRGEGLGRRDQVSYRAAKLKAKRIEDRLNRGMLQPGKIPTLAEYIERYLANQTRYAPGTRKLYRLTGRYLTGHFGADRRIDRIARSEATDWRGALARGELGKLNIQNKGVPSESTVCRTCKEAKRLFQAAVDEGILAMNPFSHLASTPPKPEKKWEYIDLPTFRRLLDACPDQDWKLLVGLCRLAGLRRGEVMRLQWSSVDMDRRRIVVNDDIEYQDTKHRRRECPIVPELYDILFAAFMDGQGGERVVTIRGSFHRGFKAIAKKAKVPMYARPFHTLRKNCEMDWLEEHKVFTVCDWLGHGPGVAQEHYNRPRDEEYEQAAGLRGGKRSKRAQNRSQSKRRIA